MEFLNIKLTSMSIDIMIQGLRELPHKVSHDLIVDLDTQRKNELKAQADQPEKRVVKRLNKKPMAPAPAPTPADDILS